MTARNVLLLLFTVLCAGTMRAKPTGSSIMHQYMSFLNHVYVSDERMAPPVVAYVQGLVGLSFWLSCADACEQKIISRIVNYHGSLPPVLQSPEKFEALNESSFKVICNILKPLSPHHQQMLSELYHNLNQSTLNERSKSAINDFVAEYTQWFKSRFDDLDGIRIYSDNTHCLKEGISWKPQVSQKPLLPHWGASLMFIEQNQILLPPPFDVSLDPNSPWMKDVLEVYQTGRQLTPQQRSIAFYWADGVATLTPPGHSMAIMTNMLKKHNSDTKITASCYALTGLILSDALRACWYNKYHYNVIRPRDFINRYIDEAWQPAIPTPPFPEYPSGHGAQAGALAQILETFFGQDTPIEDINPSQKPSRVVTYINADSLSQEIATSRLLGGIHYRHGNDMGLQLGRQIAKHTVEVFRPLFANPTDTAWFRPTDKRGVFITDKTLVASVEVCSLTGVPIKKMDIRAGLLDVSHLQADVLLVKCFDRAGKEIYQQVVLLENPIPTQAVSPHDEESFKRNRQ